MNLDDLLKELSYGPLQDLAIGGNGSGVIPAESVPKVILRINNALTALYTRFPLQKRTIVIETVDGLASYHLRKDYAQTSSSTEVNKYIKDTVADPFLGDVLMVEHVYDANHCELPLNQRKDCRSWHTQAYDSLLMDYAKTGDRYFIEYRAAHALVPFTPADPALVEIRIPPALKLALQHHVAANIYGSMNGENVLAAMQKFLNQYEGECAFVENKNAVTQTEGTEPTERFERGGWV
jgi:hypothetical protein